MSELSDALKSSVDSSPLLYEQQIIQCVVASHLFYISHQDELCPHLIYPEGYRADFTVNWHNVLYEAAATYWSGFGTQIQEGPVPKVFIENYLNAASREGKILEKEINSIEPIIISIYEIAEAGTVEALTTFLENGVLRYWLGKQLIKVYLNNNILIH